MKFMAIPNYTYLKLNMPGLASTITMGATVQHTYECEVEFCDLAKGVSKGQVLSKVLQTIGKKAPDAKKAATTFKPTDDTKEVPLDPRSTNRQTVCIGATLSPK